MKKKIVITGLLILSLGATLAFAAEQNQEQQPTAPMGHMMNWDQMKDYHKQMVEQAVKEGRMTAEQAKAMEEHMNSKQDMMKNMGSHMMGANGGSCCAGTQGQSSASQK